MRSSLLPGSGSSDAESGSLPPSFSLSEPVLPLVPGVFFRQSIEGEFEGFSSGVEELTGRSASGWMEEEVSFWDSVHEGDLQDLREHWNRCRETTEVLSTRFRLRRPDSGGVVWISERRRHVTGRSQPSHFEGHWIDVTAEAMAGERLSSAAWQGALASLTPGVAHDLNNHFASILALSDNFVRKNTADNPFYEGARTICDSVQQAARMLQRLVGLHMARSGEARYHDLNELTREVVELLRHAVSRRISFQLELCPGSMPIYGDAVEFRRVLVGLLRNAVDAIPLPASGTVTFRTSPEAALPREARPVLPGRVAPLVCLSVSDSGPGVPPSEQGRLFTPWSTTKPPSEGLGLSLALARRWAQSVGGALTFDALEGPGATFRLWLPQSDLTEADREAELRKSRTLLLIGGEASLEESAQSLREAGFHVVATSRRGLEILRTRDLPFDILCFLSDADPQEAARAVQLLRSRRWQTRVVCEAASAGGGGSVLPKPEVVVPFPLHDPVNTARLRPALEKGPGGRL